MMAQQSPPIRVTIVQPSLAKYRVPLFRELAHCPGIQLRVLYASTPGRPNVAPDGFRGNFAPMWRGRIAGHPIYWHQAQCSAADRHATDVLVLNWDVHYASLVPALLHAKANGIPTILWGHGYSKHTSLWRAGPRRKIAELATALLFYNETGRRMYRDLGWDASRLFVALNSLDQTPIRSARAEWLADPDRLARFRREQRLDDGPVVLFASRLDGARRADLLLQAAQRLRHDHPRLQVVVIGTGPAEADLRAQAAALGLAEHVRFIGACYDERELAPWFLSARVFAYPAHMGLSLLHAFGYGLPVVTGDDLANHGPEIEALEPGVNGLLFAAGGGDDGTESLAASIDRLLRDPHLCTTLSTNALQIVSEQFTMSNMVQGFQAAIGRAANRIPLNITLNSAPAKLPPPPAAGAAGRPTVAVIANAQAPYRLHLHRRVAREIPEVKLCSVFTHGAGSFPWASSAPAEIAPVFFGEQDSVANQSNPLRAVHEWRKGGRIIRWMRDAGVRLVVLQGYNDMGRLRILWWCRKRNIPCLVWGDSNVRDDDLISRGKSMIKRALLPRLLKASSGVLACGSSGAAYFARYGVSRDRIHYFTYEPDYGLIQDLPAERIEAARHRFSLDGSRRRLAFSGRLVPIKRVDLLIDAFVAIAADRPEWDLIIIGDGPLRDSLAAAVPPALRQRVIWTGFLGEQAETSAVYRACDVLVLPSEREPWALVINEAAAAGLAIVSSSVPGAAVELVRDGVNGRIFPSGNSRALAECLLDVTSEPRLTAMKAASPLILDEWRRRADPVDGLRQVLRRFRLLPAADGVKVHTCDS